jgi:predicted dienelactone hydrolase
MHSPKLAQLALLLLAAACGGNTDDPPPAVDASGTTDGSSSMIDGSTSTSDDPANNGPNQVAMSTVSIPGATTGRTLPATVFTPTGGASRPLVVISPGFQMARAQYTSYATHLATWGFVAVLTDYADTGFFADHAKLAADIPAVITWALADQTLAIDPAKIAVSGHSLGGKMSVFAASLDPRIKAVVAWDPVDSNSPSVAPEKMTSLTAAIAVVGETTNASGGGMPCAPAADNFQQFYMAAPSPAIAITVMGADHMDWVDDPSCGFCGFCTAGSASPDLSRKVTRRLDVAWLRRHLFADTTMDVWLDTPPEASSLSITRK